MRIVGRNEIDKLVALLVRIKKGHTKKFQQSRLYPKYMFWNAADNEQSKMYQTVYATPALLAEAEKVMTETAL